VKLLELLGTSEISLVLCCVYSCGQRG